MIVIIGVVLLLVDIVAAGLVLWLWRMSRCCAWLTGSAGGVPSEALSVRKALQKSTVWAMKGES